MSGRVLSIALVLLLAVGGVSAVGERRGLNWVDVELSDGRRLLSIYPSPVSYWNGTTYVPIDTRIKHSAGNYYVDGGIYRARWNSSGVVEVERGRHRLKYHLNLLDTTDKKLSLKPLLAKYSGNRLRFAISSDIDSEYMYFPTRLKHNIILKSPSSVRGRILKLRGYIELSPGLEVYVNGSRLWKATNTSQPVEFRYKGRRVFTLLPPFIYDSGNVSTLGGYELRVTGRRVLLTLSVSADWLKNSSRVYPVTIDPTVDIEFPGDDAYVAQRNGLGYGYYSFLWVQSYNPDIPSNMRAFIKFPLPSSLSGIYQYAELELHREDGTAGRTLDLYYVEDDSWSEGTINWYNQPASSSLVASQVMDETYEVFSDSALYNVVEQELSNGDSYISFMLRDRNEDSPEIAWQDFTSSEAGSNPPALKIYYNEPLDNDYARYADLTTPATFKFTAGSYDWAAVGIRNTDGRDHDIKVDDEIGFSWPYEISPLSGTTPDFVVINAHTNSGFKDYYAEAYYNTGSNSHARIEAEFYQDISSDVPDLTVGTPASGSMDVSEVLDLYEVYLSRDKSYRITLDITSGAADLDLFVFDYSHTMASRSDADSYSDNDIGGSGGDETIESFSPSESGYAAIVVVHDGTSDASSNQASYTLLVEEVQNNPPAQPSNPHPANGATDVPAAVTLSWQGGDDPDGDRVTYDVYLEAGDSTPDVLVCQDITAKSCYVGNLVYSTTYYWKVVAEDEHGATAESPVWSFTTAASPPPDDGDDLSYEEEQAIFQSGAVYDANGNPFPDPSRADAFKPVHAAELYYRHWYYGKSLEQTFGKKIENLPTELIAVRALYLAFLYKHTLDQDLKQDIKPKLKMLLDEIILRQQKEDFIWPLDGGVGKPEIGEYMNLKGYIKRSRTEVLFNRNDEYSRVPLYVGPAAMALLEGYDALDNEKYRESGLSATELCIRWLESHGLNSDGEDYYGRQDGSDYETLREYIKQITGNDLGDPPEKLHRGGDRALSTPNHYGSALLALSTAERVSSGNTYIKQIEGSLLEDNVQYTYEEIIGWIVDEVRRLQRWRSDGFEGGIRDGPIDKVDLFNICAISGPFENRLVEKIGYAGITANGMRQAYDLTGNQKAYSFLRDLADHYWNMRQGYNGKPGKWYDYYDLDRHEPLCGNQNQENIYWAALIELAGEYTRGFRQAMVDHGSFLSSGDMMLNYVIVQAIKMRENRYVIIPINDTELLLSLGVPRKLFLGYSNPIIYSGDVKTITVSVDQFMGRLTAEMKHKSNSNILEFSIYTPDGVKITSNNYNSFSNVNYQVNGTYEVYTVDNPQPGNWTLELKAVDVPPEGELYYMQAYTGSLVFVDIETDAEWYFRGDKATIFVRVINDTEVLTNVKVSGELIYPNGRKILLNFNDNGTNGDFQAGDGIFTYVFGDTQQVGYYTVKVTATGELGGVDFTRKAEASFEIVGKTENKEAFISGLLYKDSISHGDTLNVLIYVENTGNINIDDRILYIIKSTDGKSIYIKRKPIYLEAGEGRFLRFYWKIPENAASGRYWFIVEFENEQIDHIPMVKIIKVR